MRIGSFLQMSAGRWLAFRGLVTSTAAIVLILSCSGSRVKPVDFIDGDMCSFCKMAISEKRYACEIVDIDGEANKFDDIGCMRNYIEKQRPQPGAIFFVDFNSKQWLENKKAFFVRSNEFQTPMGGQVAAFVDQQSATDAAKKYHGQLVSSW